MILELGHVPERVLPALAARQRRLVLELDDLRPQLERILAWPFERVVVAHGDVSEKGGREEFMRGYAWVLDQGRPA